MLSQLSSNIDSVRAKKDQLTIALCDHIQISARECLLQDVNRFEKYLNNIKLGIPLQGKCCLLIYIPSEEDKADFEKFKEQQEINMLDGECSLIENFLMMTMEMTVIVRRRDGSIILLMAVRKMKGKNQTNNFMIQITRNLLPKLGFN